MEKNILRLRFLKINKNKEVSSDTTRNSQFKKFNLISSIILDYNIHTVE